MQAVNSCWQTLNIGDVVYFDSLTVNKQHLQIKLKILLLEIVINSKQKSGQTFSSRTAFSPLTWVRLLISVLPCWHSVWRPLTSSLSFFSSRSPICKAFGADKERFIHTYWEVCNSLNQLNSVLILVVKFSILDQDINCTFSPDSFVVHSGTSSQQMPYKRHPPVMGASVPLFGVRFRHI